MRILVTGSRKWDDGEIIRDVLRDFDERHPGIKTLVSGGAKGADDLAERYAKWLGWRIERHNAAWHVHGRRAGYVRNAEMVKLGADLCLAFIRNSSPGATMTAELAIKSGMDTLIYKFEEDEGVEA